MDVKGETMSNERANTHQDGHPSTRFGALWHQADFLKLWAGETVSLVGSQVTTLALPLTAVILLKATSVQLGFLYAAGFAPFLFLTLFAGVWVDHHRRRPMLLVTNIGRAVLLGLIPCWP
jgi:MFS family permease